MMTFKARKRIGVVLLSACVFLTCTCLTHGVSYAEGEETAKVYFEDVTKEDLTLISGEAKIKVSVDTVGSVSRINAAFVLGGKAEYRRVDFLKGSDEHGSGDIQLAVPGTKTLTVGLISSTPIKAEGKTELFIITFEGRAGDKATVTLDKAHSYVIADGKQIALSADEAGEATASESTNESRKATVKLKMDKVTSFDESNKDGVVNIKITNQRTGSVIKTALSEENRGSATVSSYTVSRNVLKGDKYTVEIMGIGYIPYKKTDVTFSKALELTNADFVPGDVNGDGVVDDTDKSKVQDIIDGKEEYTIAADFNRDGYVDDDDLAVFETSEGGGGGSGGGNGGGNGTGGGSFGGSSGGSAGGSGGGFSGGTAVTPSNNECFVDLENHAWAKKSIYALKSKGIINGVSEIKFAPADNIKRGDFMLILTRMLGVNDSFTENFPDVPAEAYYYNAVGSAKAAGIAVGGDYGFMPEESIKRQDLITLAYRAFLNKGYISPTDDLSVLDAFADRSEIAEYAVNAMAAMVKSGIIQGSDGGVNPKGNATRAEVAVMCERMLNLIK